jgi:hypothetical protein
MWTQRRIITSFWNFTDIPRSHYPKISEEGYTTLPIANDLGNLQAAAALGIRVIYASEFFDSSSIDIPSRRASLDSIIAALQIAGNVSGIFIGDEPSTANFPEIKRMFDFIKVSLPSVLPYVNLLPIHATEAQMGIDYASIDQSSPIFAFFSDWLGTSSRRREIISYVSYVQRFINECNPLVLSWDLHPFVALDRDDFTLNLAIISHLAKKNGIPFFNTVQAGADDASWQIPDEAQLRWQVYQSIAYGCRGVVYYTYWGTASTGSLYQSGVPSPLAGVAAQINKEIRSISTAIVNYPLINTYHSGSIPVGDKQIPTTPINIQSSSPITVGFFGSNDLLQSIMVANNSYYEPCEVTISTDKHVWQVNLDNGDWRSLSSRPNEKIVLKIAPGSAALLPVISYWWNTPATPAKQNDYSPEWKQAHQPANTTWRPRGLLIMHWDWFDPPASSLPSTVQEGFSHGTMHSDQIIAANDAGLLSIVKGLTTKSAIRDAATITSLEQQIDQLKPITGLDGYLLVDEPAISGFADLRTISDIVKARDPARLRYINLNPMGAPLEQYGLMPTQVPSISGSPLYPVDLSNMPPSAQSNALSWLEYLRQFVEVVQPQLLCYDHYYLIKGNTNHSWFLNLELVKIVSKFHGIPFMVIFQASSDSSDWELVTEGALRQQFYSILAYGAIGGSYYTYWGFAQYKSLYQSGVKTALMSSVKELNFELLNARWFLAATHIATYHTGVLPIGVRPLPSGQIVEVLGSAQVCVGIFSNFESKPGFILSDRDWSGSNKWISIRTTGRRLYRWTRSGEWQRVRKDPGGVSTLFWRAGDGAFFKID